MDGWMDGWMVTTWACVIQKVSKALCDPLAFIPTLCDHIFTGLTTTYYKLLGMVEARSVN